MFQYAVTRRMSGSAIASVLSPCIPSQGHGGDADLALQVPGGRGRPGVADHHGKAGKTHKRGEIWWNYPMCPHGYIVSRNNI